MIDFVKIFRKRIDGYPLEGYLLTKSRTLTLLQLFNPDFMDFNGYTVVRNCDITRTTILKPHSFILRALELKGLEPKPAKGVVVEDWPSVIMSGSQSFSVITIHTEVANPEMCFIGRPSVVSTHSFGLSEIDPKANWSRSRSYRFNDLTKVDFGSRYEAALVAVSEMEAKRKKSGTKNRKSSPRMLRTE